MKEEMGPVPFQERLLFLRPLIPWILAGFLGFLTIAIASQFAMNKYFNRDEGFDISTTCHMPFQKVISGSIGQPNNNPLYYLFQSWNLASISAIDDSILIKFRRISIWATAVLIVLLFYFVYKKFGFLWAGLSCLVLMNQKIFFYYAAEARHYMLWLLFFTMLVLLTAHLCSRPYSQVFLRDKVLFACVSIGISLIVSMGAIQVVGAVATCWLFWCFFHSPSERFRPVLYFALPVLAFCLALEVFYGFKKAADFGQFSGSSYDLFSQLQKGEYGLLKLIPRLLLPKPLRDTSVAGYIENIFVLIGILSPVWYWRKRSLLRQGDINSVSLSLAASAQIVMTLLIAGIIAFYHFYFINRVFLYLIVGHSLLSLVGGYFVFRRLSDYKIPIRVLKIVLFLFFMSATYCQYCQSYVFSQPDFLCDLVEGSLPGRLIDKYVGGREFSQLNLIVDLSRTVKSCRLAARKINKMYVWQDGNHEWKLTETFPSGTYPLGFCGNPVSF